MKIAICDDEKIIRDQIRKYIKVQNYDISVDEYASGSDFLESSEKYDFIFMDIDMPGLSGIETVEKFIKKGNHSLIIFLTSYTEYVFDAFKVRAFRFLTKPIDKEKFNEAYENAVQNCQIGKISINYKGVINQLRVDEIVYIESAGEGTYIHDCNKKIYQSSTGLKEWCNMLYKYYFFRIHKSYIVSMFYIRSVEKNMIRLINCDDTLIISRRNISEFRAAYLEFIKKNAKVM